MSTVSEAAHRRPRSLAEVVEWGSALGERDAWFREFLDEFYLAPDAATRAAMLAEEPALIDARANAYLAATAEQLAAEYGLPCPAWVNEKERFLETPWYPLDLKSLRPIFDAESPPAFRRRNIFVDGSALYRPRKDLERDQ